MIILSTHCGKLSYITTVSSPQKHIKISIRQWQSIQGSQVLRILGCGYGSFGSRVPDPLSWVLILDYARKKKGKTRKSLCLTIPKLSISSSYFLLKCHSLYILEFPGIPYFGLSNEIKTLKIFFQDFQ